MNHKYSKGFTLIELLVVITVISILIVMSFSTYESVQMRARDVKRKTDLYHIQEALEQYYIKNGSYPVGKAGSDRDCWINNARVGYYAGCNPLYDLVEGGFIQRLPIDPGRNAPIIPEDWSCGNGQFYMYISDNGVDESEDGLTGKAYRLGAVQESQGNSGCTCSMWAASQQFCIRNKQ